METPKARQIHVLVVIPDHEQQLHAQIVHDSIRMREARIIDSRFRRLLNEKLAPFLHKKPKSISNATLGQSEIARLEKGKQIMHFAPVEYGEVFWSEEVQTQADAITNKAVLTHLLLLFSAAY
ncbi:hypothetical protein KXD40_002084 [Peronospora effusa]|uniref:Uncharacterized protein n=1 Tax=Peronospora effusa TaxID=542832 RepID=A0A3M6VJ67_9STRA|nr:hypothetical protein DD238_002113 [Peronospora effusa]RQM18208.1 hypothetical protein DD237_000118 [Peronospora effusa]UIZ26244.1 hypothetical protein KXD40_002084 [Peronospora effusa]